MGVGRWVGLAALLWLTGCGTNQYDVGPFESYVRTFRAERVHYGEDKEIPRLRMSFKEVTEGLQGLCSFEPNVKFDGLLSFELVPTVYIDPDAWNSSDDWDREALVMHELGHCLLGRPHDSRVKESGIPRSLMYPTKMQTRVYETHRAYFLEELFNPPPELELD